MINILCEEPYRESVWCKEILTGLTDALKRKRLQYEEIKNIDEADSELIAVGTNYAWLNNVIYSSNKKGVTPILLSNRVDCLLKGKYHSVSTDISDSMTQLVNTLRSKGKTRIALYGVNRTSVSDISRAESFNNVSGKNSDIFYNNGSLDDCFLSFLPHINDFDAVLCVNGLVAVSFAKRIMRTNPELLDKLCIISCSKIILKTGVAEHIICVDSNFENFGNAAIIIADVVKKNKYISNINISLNWDIDDENFLDKMNAKNENLTMPQHIFYEDNEATQMLNLNNLLLACTQTDLQILNLLINKTPYHEIAERCFMSESSIKYRIKKYIELSHTKDKAELLNLLNAYYDPT